MGVLTLQETIAVARAQGASAVDLAAQFRQEYNRPGYANDGAYNAQVNHRAKMLNVANHNDPDQTVYKSMGVFLWDQYQWGRGERAGSVQDRRKSYLEQFDSKLNDANQFFVGKAFPAGYNEMTAQDGGVLVPPQFVNEILLRTYDNDLLSRVRLFNQLSSNILKIPAVNEISRVDGSRFGGVNSYWGEEGAALAAETKASLKYVELKLNKLYVLARVTEEMLEDAGYTLDNFLSYIVAEEFKFRLGQVLVSGDGVGKPQGLLFSAGPKVAQAAESGQTISTPILPMNLYNMYSRGWVGIRNEMVWLVHSTVWPELFKLTQGNFPIALFQNSISGKPISTLLGLPIIETEFNSVLGTEGDIILAHLPSVLWATKGNMRAFTSMHIYWATDEQAFKFRMRVDGKNWWTQALTPYKGTTTVSSVVTLATRT